MRKFWAWLTDGYLVELNEDGRKIVRVARRTSYHGLIADKHHLNEIDNTWSFGTWRYLK